MELPSRSSDGDLVRQHLMSLGAKIMTPEAVKDHMATAFGGEVASSVPAASTAAPFILRADPLVINPGKKSKSKARSVVTADGAPGPTLLVEYIAKLDNGVPIRIPEYAHLVKVDGETLLLGFPISNKSRLKPLRSAQIEIQTKDKQMNCYCTGIHVDIPEWGISLSVYLILPNV